MIIVNTISEKYFSLNGLNFAKIYQPLKQGSENIGIYNVNDTRQQLLQSTSYSDISVNGVVYSSQAETIERLLEVIYENSFVSETLNLIDSKTEKGGYSGTAQDLKDEIDSKAFEGLKTYQTLVDLNAVDPVPEEGTPAKVSNDNDSDNNGYYSVVSGSWVKDSQVVENVITEENSSKSVSGNAVFGRSQVSNLSLLFSSGYQFFEMVSENTGVICVILKGSDFDVTNDYYVKFFRSNLSGYEYFTVSETNESSVTGVCRHKIVTTNPTGKQWLKLESQAQNVEGYALVDWDLIQGINNGNFNDNGLTVGVDFLPEMNYVDLSGLNNSVGSNTEDIENIKSFLGLVNELGVDSRMNEDTVIASSTSVGGFNFSINSANMSIQEGGVRFDFNNTGTVNFNDVDLLENINSSVKVSFKVKWLSGGTSLKVAVTTSTSGSYDVSSSNEWQDVEVVLPKTSEYPNRLAFLIIGAVSGLSFIMKDLVVVDAEIEEGAFQEEINVLKSKNEFSDVMTEEDSRLLISEKLYLFEPLLFRLFKRSLISRSELDNKNVFLFGNDGTGFDVYIEYIQEQLKSSFSEVPESLTFAHSIPVKGNEKTIYGREVVVEKALLSEVNAKTNSVLVIGDSITDGSLAAYFGRINTEFGANLDFKGLFTDSGIKNEGRSSWAYSMLVGAKNDRHGTPIFPQASNDGSASLVKNPFIRIATAQELIDFPERCFENTPATSGVAKGVEAIELNYTESQAAGGYTGDYYIFSFENYMNNHSSAVTSGEDFVILNCLGFNDLDYNSINSSGVNMAAYSDGVIDKAVEYAGFVIDSKVSYCESNSIGYSVGVAGLISFSIDRNWIQASKYIEKIIDLCESKKASGKNVEFVPVLASFDRRLSWNFNNESDLSSVVSGTDSRNKIYFPSDDRHPYHLGRILMGNVLMSFIANKIK